MKVKQLSLFLENKRGRLLEATEVLASHDINIHALTIAETADYGIVRLIVEKTQEARDLLKMHDFTVDSTDVIAAEVDDQPGKLSRVLKAVEEKELDIEYIYSFVERQQNKAIIILKIEQIDKAIETLNKKGIKTLSQDELYK